MNVDWPVTTAAVAVSTGETFGPLDRPLRWASVTKVLAAVATWVAVEEGTVALDDAAGPTGSTVRHLLAHASGLAFDTDAVIARPGARRIYSNTGIEVLADHVARRAGIPFLTYIDEGVLQPLGMSSTRLDGSPAHAAVGPVVDLMALGQELLQPTLVAAETWREATAVQFPGIGGVLPGFGGMAVNDWGLGVELHDGKAPHWMPPSASPRAFGHFGGAGGFLWVDPDAGVACACLTDRDFGPWAAEAWPALGEAILSRRRSARG